MTKSSILSLSVGQSVETIRYNYTEEELMALKDEVAQQLIEINDKEDAFKEIRQEHQLQMKRLKTKLSNVICSVKNGFDFKSLEVHHVPDDDRQVVEFYSVETGELVGERPMTYAEKTQKRIPFTNH